MDVAARPERDDVAASSRRYGSSSGSSDGTTAARAVAHPDQQLRLGARDALERAHLLEVDRPDVRDHADVRLADRRQLGDLAEAAHRQLEHEHLGARRRREQLERQPDLGVEVRAARRDGAVRRDQRGDQVLRRRLADRAGDGDHVRGELAPPGARERAERRDGMLGGEHGAASPAPPRRAPRPARASTPQAPARSASAANAPPSTRSPGHADEQVAGLDRARVDHHARRARRRRGRQPAHELGAGRAGDPLVGPVPHRRAAAPRARPRRRRTAPCARPRTPAPARAPCRRSRRRRRAAASAIARRDRRAPVGVALHVRARRPGRRRGSRR